VGGFVRPRKPRMREKTAALPVAWKDQKNLEKSSIASKLSRCEKEKKKEKRIERWGGDRTHGPSTTAFNKRAGRLANVSGPRLYKQYRAAGLAPSSRNKTPSSRRASRRGPKVKYRCQRGEEKVGSTPRAAAGTKMEGVPRSVVGRENHSKRSRKT